MVFSFFSKLKKNGFFVHKKTTLEMKRKMTKSGQEMIAIWSKNDQNIRVGPKKWPLFLHFWPFFWHFLWLYRGSQWENDDFRGQKWRFWPFLVQLQMTCFKKVRKRHMKLTKSGKKVKKKVQKVPKMAILGNFKKNFLKFDPQRLEKKPLENSREEQKNEISEPEKITLPEKRKKSIFLKNTKIEPRSYWGNWHKNDQKCKKWPKIPPKIGG